MAKQDSSKDNLPKNILSEEYLKRQYADYLKINDYRFQVTCKCGKYINVPFKDAKCPVCKIKI